MQTTDLLNIIFSTSAFVISIYTLWKMYLSPFSLLITPPTISQVNDQYPSLLLDIGFHNEGSRSAMVSNMLVKAFAEGEELACVMWVQEELNRFQIGSLPLKEEAGKAYFVPFVVKKGETEIKKLLFTIFLDDRKVQFEKFIKIDSINIEIMVNGKWYSVFRMQYDGFQQKFKNDNTIHIPEKGFCPIYYHGTIEPVCLKGRIFVR